MWHPVQAARIGVRDSLSAWAEGIGENADPTQDLPDFLDQFAQGTLEQAEDQLLSGPLSIGPKPVSGGACSCSVKASPDEPGDWSSGTVIGTFSCGPSSSPYASVSLSANWDGTGVTLGDLTGSFAGSDISDDAGQAFSVLDNPADDLGDMVDGLVSGLVSQLGTFVESGFEVADNAASVVEGLNNPGTALSVPRLARRRRRRGRRRRARRRPRPQRLHRPGHGPGRARARPADLRHRDQPEGRQRHRRQRHRRHLNPTSARSPSVSWTAFQQPSKCSWRVAWLHVLARTGAGCSRSCEGPPLAPPPSTGKRP